MASLTEPTHIDEPAAAEEYADVLSQVAAEGKTVIVRRNGTDFAAVIPLSSLELLNEALARQAVEIQAEQIDWDRARQALRPAQSWLEGDEPKPF